MNSKRTLVVHLPNGSAEHYGLEGVVTVGTERDADVRFDANANMSASHLRLRPSEDGVVVEVAPNAPSGAYFAGQEHRVVTVPWGEEVHVGDARLSFVMVRGNGRSKAAPLLLGMAGLVAVVSAGAAGAQVFEPALPSMQDVEPSPLTGRVESCDVSEGPVTDYRANEAERAALAERERFPFAPSEGIRALRALQESEDCFRKLGREADRKRVERELASWSERLNANYGALRLQLRVALDQSRYTEALATTTELETLLGDASGPYAEWLSSLRRELEQRIARTKS